MARFYSLLNLLLGIWVALINSLSLSAPLRSNQTLGLVKRVDSTYDIWKSIPNTQLAMGDSALFFKIDESVNDAWGITFLYGCTALIISDPDFVIVAHMQQVTGNQKICINDPASIKKWLETKLQLALDQADAERLTEVELIFNSNDCHKNSKGIKQIESFLVDEWGLDRNNVAKQSYGGSSGTGSPIPNQPHGLAVVRWLKPAPGSSSLTRGTLETRFNSDNPRRNQVFDKKS